MDFSHPGEAMPRGGPAVTTARARSARLAVCYPGIFFPRLTPSRARGSIRRAPLRCLRWSTIPSTRISARSLALTLCGGARRWRHISTIPSDRGAQIGRVVHLEEADIGVAVWLLPQSDDVQERERSRKRAYLHAVLGEYGCERYERIVAYMSARAGTVVGKESWYLSIVAIAPQAQGRGLGARLLAPTLAEADAAMAVCYLETFNPRSLHFYEHLGFVTRAEFDEPATRAQYTIMVRAPRNNPGDRDRRYRDNVTDGS